MKPYKKKSKKDWQYGRKKISRHLFVSGWHCSTISTLEHLPQTPPKWFLNLHNKLIKIESKNS